MLNELENKIRKAIPEVMELGVGCRFQFKGNSIIHTVADKKLEPNVYMVSKTRLLAYGYEYKKTDLNIIGKPIQLNHVLEYVDKLDKRILPIVYGWNLKSNLLSDQSIELISFVNELK